MSEPVDYAARAARFEREISTAQTQREVLELLAVEVNNSLGYSRSWMSVMEPDGENVRILAPEFSGGEDFWAAADLVPIEGDAYVTLLVESGEPQIVVDAQIDPTVNREIVEQLGSRTIVNVPINIEGHMFGAVGTGTFGDEGPRPPTDAEVEHLKAIGDVAGAAMSRILQLAGHIPAE